MKIRCITLSAFLLSIISLLGCAPTQRASQTAATVPATIPADASLKVEMDAGKSVRLSLAEIARLPHEKVRVTERDGTTIEYSGVPLANILATVDAPIGNKLRGSNLSLYIVAQGADHYQATYSIVEADPAFGERQILIADQQNGQPLPARAAPLQVIVPQDKMRARWVRSLVALSVRRAE